MHIGSARVSLIALTLLATALPAAAQQVEECGVLIDAGPSCPLFLEGDGGQLYGLNLSDVAGDFPYVPGDRVSIEASWGPICGTHNCQLGQACVTVDGPVVGCSVGTSYCRSEVNSTGFAARIGTRGSASVGANDLVLETSLVQPGASGLFFYGPNQIKVPFGNGTRCVGGVVHRIGIAAASGQGRIVRGVDYAALPPGGQIAAGATWNFQCWFRDLLGGGAQFDLSDAVSITFGP